MTRRELEQWVAASRARLAGRGITVLFGFGPSIGRHGGASWVSFISRRGTGRLVRAPEGSSRVDVYAFAHGACLAEEGGEDTLVAQLDRIADLLSPRAAVR